MKRLNVRCCCQPTKILGTLPDVRGHYYIKRFFERPDHDAEPVETVVSLSKDTFYDHDFRKETAYRADGVELETLRKLPDFEPLTEGDNATTAADRPGAPRAGEVAASDGDFACPVTFADRTREQIAAAFRLPTELLNRIGR
jgi:hypothetical protein